MGAYDKYYDGGSQAPSRWNNRNRDALVNAISPNYTLPTDPGQMQVGNQVAAPMTAPDLSRGLPGLPMESQSPTVTVSGIGNDSEGSGGFSGTQGSGPSSVSGGHPWDGLTGAALANNPDYIRSMALQTLTKRYGSEDQIPAGQLDYVINAVSKPDTFSDQYIRQGWNPYWEDRFGNAASQAGSSVDAGTDTIVGREQGPPRGPGHTVENALNGFTGGNPNAAMANLISAGAGTGLNSVLQGDPFSRIQDSLQKINGNGQVNLDALIRQLQGV